VHHAGVVGDDVVEISRLLESADDGVVRPLEDSDDTAFGAIAAAAGPSVLGVARDPGHDPVAVHCRAGVFGRDKDVACIGAFAREETKTGLVDLNLAGHEVGFGRKDVAVLADARDLAGSFQFAQRIFQVAPVLALEAEGAGQLFLVERAVLGRPEEGENSLFGVGVAFHVAER
jgi:hypothetical protein